MKKTHFEKMQSKYIHTHIIYILTCFCPKHLKRGGIEAHALRKHAPPRHLGGGEAFDLENAEIYLLLK